MLRPGILERPALVDPVAQLGSYLIELWDAERSDLMTIGGGGEVSAWAGVKAGLNLTQGTGSLQPVWSATSFGGAAGVTFDGTDDTLALTLAGQLPAAGSPSEMWAVVSQDAPQSDTGTRTIVAYGSSAAATSRSLIRGANHARALTGDGSAGQAATDDVELIGRVFVSSTIDETRTSLRHNGPGVVCTVPVVPNTTATRIRFGASAAGTAAQFWLGQIVLVAITLPLPLTLAVPFAGYMLRRRRL